MCISGVGCSFFPRHQALSGLARCLEMHPSQHESRVVEEGVADISTAAPHDSCPDMDQSVPHSASVEEGAQPASNGASIWKQVNLKLDWAHIGPADLAVPSGLTSCRREELAVVKKKIEEIKLVARRAVATYRNATSAGSPWLDADVTVAACLCAKSAKGNGAENETEAEGCCKRQKLSE